MFIWSLCWLLAASRLFFSPLHVASGCFDGLLSAYRAPWSFRGGGIEAGFALEALLRKIVCRCSACMLVPYRKRPGANCGQRFFRTKKKVSKRPNLVVFPPTFDGLLNSRPKNICGFGWFGVLRTFSILEFSFFSFFSLRSVLSGGSRRVGRDPPMATHPRPAAVEVN